MKMHSIAGFTLLEMMVVITLVSILSLGGWHGWQQWQQRQQLNDSAQQILRLLLRLRSAANWHNTERLIWLKSGERWCLGAGQVSEHCPPHGRDTLLAPWPAVSVQSVTAGIGFYGKKNSAWPGSITIVSGAGERRIIVSARGRVRICPQSGENCR